jgi:hypothetical protein
VFQWLYSEIADLLEIEGDNPFRIRAYRNGARTLRSPWGPGGFMPCTTNWTSTGRSFEMFYAGLALSAGLTDFFRVIPCCSARKRPSSSSGTS